MLLDLSVKHEEPVWLDLIYPCCGDCPMTAEITPSFASLSATAKAVNDESDRINKLIRTVDDALGRLNLGLPVWLPHPIIQDPLPTSKSILDPNFTFMGYDKLEKQWSVCLEFNERYDKGPGQKYRLRDATRENKLSAVSHLEELVGEMNRRAQEKLEQIAAARKITEDVIGKLGKLAR